MARDGGDRWSVGWTLGRLGAVAYAEGDYPGASALYQEGLAILRELHDSWGIASILEGFAPVAFALAAPGPAARIWGAVERLRDEVGAVMPPSDRQHYEIQLASARAALGDDAGFDVAWREGRAMSLDQAVNYALALDTDGNKSLE